MTSKTYFAIGTLFIILYVLTSFGEAVGIPGWVHQFCTVVFAVAIFLGLKKKKQENSVK